MERGRSGWIFATCILKAEQIRFADTFYVNIRKRSSNDSKYFGQKDEIAIY